MNKNKYPVNSITNIKINLLCDKLNNLNNTINHLYSFVLFLIPINITIAIYTRNSKSFPFWLLTIVFLFLFCFLLPKLIEKISRTKLYDKRSNYNLDKKIKKGSRSEMMEWILNKDDSLTFYNLFLNYILEEIKSKKQCFWFITFWLLFNFIIMLLGMLVQANIII